MAKGEVAMSKIPPISIFSGRKILMWVMAHAYSKHDTTDPSTNDGTGIEPTHLDGMSVAVDMAPHHQ